MTGFLTRRRFLTITAAAGASVTLGISAPGHTSWRGTALGANAEMIFAGCRPGEADAVIAACRAEIARLEQIFSLYDETSEISRLNRDGALTMPSADLLQLLRLAQWFSEQTGGAFDCTVQSAWRRLVDHFSATPDQPPQETNVAVGFSTLQIAPHEVRLPEGGAITLNGIAQGYVTDRVANLLRDMGWRDVLVNLGEVRALPGRSWPVRLATGRLQTAISDQAVATSAGSGTPFNTAGDWHHLIDPRTGVSANHVRAVTVRAPDAVTADALSTAIAVATPAEARAIAAKSPAVVVYVQDHDGQIARL